MSEALSVSPPNTPAIAAAILDLALHNQNDIAFNGSSLYEFPLPQDMQGGKTPFFVVREPTLAGYAEGGRLMSGAEGARMAETVETVWDFEIVALWPHDPPGIVHYSDVDQATVTLWALYQSAYNLKGTCENCVVLPGQGREYINLDDSWFIAARLVVRAYENLPISYASDSPEDLSRSLVDDLLLEDSLTV